MTSEIESPYLFVGGKGQVFALSKHSGNLAWQVELKKAGLLGIRTGNDFVTLVEGVSHLYAFAYGRAYCLNKRSGDIVWQSELKDLKHSIASLAVDANLLGAAHRSVVSDAWVAAGAVGDGDGSGDGDGGGDGGD